jgi:hypothetical protein
VPSTVTTAISARIPNEQAAELREQATRHGLTVSRLVAGIVATQLSAGSGILVLDGHRNPDGLPAVLP